MNATEAVFYRGSSGSRVLAVTAITVASAAALCSLVDGILHAYPPLFAFAALLIGLALEQFWVWSRFGYEVKLTDDKLIWLALFRTREVRLTEIRELRRTRFPSRLAVLEIDGGAHLLVDKRAGFVQFAVALGRAAPHLQVWA